MDQEAITYYDKESSVYSEKRYDSEMVDFTQFYFRKRLAYVLGYVRKAGEGKRGLDLLEVGCADGIVIRKIEKMFPDMFASILGIDISPGMIEEANKRNRDPRVSFALRGQNDPEKRYDMILEVGFLLPPMLKDEIPYVLAGLKEGGYCISSLPSKYSLRAFLKLKGNANAKTYRRFGEYEEILGRHFDIVGKETYGLFIPLIWKLPFLARIIQPALESLLKYILPELFHERIYLLKKKSNQ
ncbi:MAG: hypothetical protein JWN50_414 [Parcubacteria group bacterium]|nr:hypothetical protein [Parcubacteria group bacterium]